MTRKKLICVGGARPNFMKLAPLYLQLAQSPEFEPVLVHTGQHYDEKMSGMFFRDLGLPSPKYNLGVGSASHAVQTAEVMRRLEPVVIEEKPDGVVVVGDVNSTVATALVAKKLNVPVVHVEAGLRSFDRTMPEEINRIVTDSITDVFLVSEPSGVRNLRREGVPDDRVHLVGNLMIDSLMKHISRAREIALDTVVPDLNTPYALTTLHRPANVDDPAKMAEILGALSKIAETIPIVFPVHPRTRQKLNSLPEPVSPRIRLLDPLGYIEFLSLVASADVVLTDSGGIQEETTALCIPCLTIRDNTERPATVEEGSNKLAGTRADSILAAWDDLRQRPSSGRAPQGWDGQAAQRSLAVLSAYFSSPSV